MSELIALDLDYQTLLISELLHNVQYCELARDTIKAENFSDRSLQWFFDTLVKSDIHHSKTTLKEALAKAAASKIIKKEEVPRYIEVFKSITKPPTALESEHIKNTLVQFIRTQNCKRAIMDSMDLIQEGKWDSVEQAISEAIASGVDLLSMGQDYMEQVDARLKRREAMGDTLKLSTGIPDLDEVLNGGIENKQVALCVGGTGRGKTVYLTWAARHALMLGKNVVYFTFEIPEDKIAERLDSMITRIKPHELKTYTKESAEKLALFGKRYAGGKLFIKEFGPDTTTVSGLRTYLKQLASQGIKADLVVVDYLDLIKPHRVYGDVHVEMDAIIKALSGLSKELDTRILTATQLNRAGMVAENPDETSIAGTVNKLFNVDVAFFLAQNKEERELEEMRIIIIKSRNGSAGKYIKIETDYSYMTFYRAMKKAEPDPSEDEEQA